MTGRPESFKRCVGPLLKTLPSFKQMWGVVSEKNVAKNVYHIMQCPTMNQAEKQEVDDW